jgi:diphosphomevalonate decarboxylase
MTNATALAHANLAFVKYWGKKDPRLNIPLNNSISMNLSAARTTTSVELDPTLTTDTVILNGVAAGEKFTARVHAHLNLCRELTTSSTYARVETHNSFPASAGFASSASGFAALTVAAVHAMGRDDLSQPELSIIARRGSGSACRSIPGGFVEWFAGKKHQASYAVQIAPPEHWDIVDVAVIVSDHAKDVSSSQGHLQATNSPFWPVRSEQLPPRLDTVRTAILERDFETFGREIETEAMSMHSIMMTSAHEIDGSWRSGIYYWSPDTLELLIATQQWRADGLPVYFTLDAGPTVHLICPAEHEAQVVAAVKTTQGDRDWSLLISHPAPGTRIVSTE